MAGKWVELLKEIAPRIDRVAFERPQPDPHRARQALIGDRVRDDARGREIEARERVVALLARLLHQHALARRASEVRDE